MAHTDWLVNNKSISLVAELACAVNRNKSESEMLLQLMVELKSADENSKIAFLKQFSGWIAYYMQSEDKVRNVERAFSNLWLYKKFMPLLQCREISVTILDFYDKYKFRFLPSRLSHKEDRDFCKEAFFWCLVLIATEPSLFPSEVVAEVQSEPWLGDLKQRLKKFIKD